MQPTAVELDAFLSDDTSPPAPIHAEGHRRLFDAVVAADIPGALGR